MISGDAEVSITVTVEGGSGIEIVLKVPVARLIDSDEPYVVIRRMIGEQLADLEDCQKLVAE